MGQLKTIQIYTDGACKGNGREGASPGGFGAILINNDSILEVKGSKSDTTNNEMEFAALWAALNQIQNPKFHFEIYLDSSHVLDTFEKFIINYRKNGYLRADKKPIKNQKLIMLIDEQLSKLESYKFNKVKGHSGNKWNERADELANEAVANLINSKAEKIEVAEKDVFGLIPKKHYTGVGNGCMMTFEYLGNNNIQAISITNMAENYIWPEASLEEFNKNLPLLSENINPNTIHEIVVS